MAGMLACLIFGCGDAQQRKEHEKPLPDLTETSDGGRQPWTTPTYLHRRFNYSTCHIN